MTRASTLLCLYTSLLAGCTLALSVLAAHPCPEGAAPRCDGSVLVTCVDRVEAREDCGEAACIESLGSCDRCGDGILVAGSSEVCDDGNNEGGDGCRADCLGLEICGDGLLDDAAGEGCDEGAQNSDAPNASDCRTDCTPRRCGDGILDDQFGEECDDGNSTNNDGCKNNCTIH